MITLARHEHEEKAICGGRYQLAPDSRSAWAGLQSIWCHGGASWSCGNGKHELLEGRDELLSLISWTAWGTGELSEACPSHWGCTWAPSVARTLMDPLYPAATLKELLGSFQQLYPCPVGTTKQSFTTKMTDRWWF